MAKRGKTRDLVQLLKNEVASRGSIRAVAKGIGLTEGRLGRVLAGQHSLSVESCLRFSDLTGEPASKVLRAAGKEKVAGLIEKLYATSDEVISPTEKALLKRFRDLPPKPQRMVRDLLETLTEALNCRDGVA